MKILKKIGVGILAGILSTSPIIKDKLNNSDQKEFEKENKIHQIIRDLKQILLTKEEILEIKKEEISKKDIFFQIRNNNNLWFGDNKDKILKEIFEKFLNNSKKEDNIFTIQELQLLLKFKISYEIFFQINSKINQNHIHNIYHQLYSISLNIEEKIIKNKISLYNEKKELKNQNIPNLSQNYQNGIEMLEELVKLYHSSNKFEHITYENQEIYTIINNNQQYINLLDIKNKLQKQTTLTQKQKDYLYIINRLLPFYAFQKRKESILILLENHKFHNSEFNILVNVRNQNYSLDNSSKNTKINFSQINQNLANLNLRFGNEYNISLRILNTIALIENNFGNNLTSSSDAFGPFQVKNILISKFNNGKSFSQIPSEQRFWTSYITGIKHIQYIISKYKLNLDFKEHIPNLSENNFKKLKRNQKETIIDFLTLLSIYYDGEGDRFLNSIGNLTTHGNDGGSLNYVKKGINTLHYSFIIETESKITHFKTNPNNYIEKIF